MKTLQHEFQRSNVAKHAWTYDYVIDFLNSKVIDSGSYTHKHTAVTNNADNKSMLLPGHYTRAHKEKHVNM